MVSTLPQIASRVELAGIDWQMYQAIRAEPDNRHIRLTYYQGMLEAVAPSPEHEYIKKVMGRFVETLAEEFVVNLYPLGSTTLEREDLASGSEPDECFYLTVSKIQKIRGKKRIDLKQDPAPDLVVKVDITSRSQYREQVYSALQVPEIWIYSGQSLSMLRLEENKYVPIQSSLAFPTVEAKDIELFLSQAMEKDYLTLIRDFKSWLKKA